MLAVRKVQQFLHPLYSSPFSAMVLGKQSVIRVGNILTARFCDDGWREEVPNEPKLRPICRFILTFTMLCLMLVGTVLLFQFRTDSFRSVRYLGNELLPTIYNERMNESSSQMNTGKLLCPCTNQNRIAWSSLMKMFLLSKKSEQFEKYGITDSHDFCWKEWKSIPASSYLYWGCPVMVESLMSTGTKILTSTLLNRDLLVNTVAKAIEESVTSALSSYRVLLNLNATEWYMVEELGKAFLEMKTVFAQNSSSSDEDYWNAFLSSTAPDHKTLQAVLVGRALTLELNWTTYLNQCSPVYCDEVLQNSLLTRFLSAVAQMGGLISAILFVVRSLLWPGLRFAAGWSVHQPPSMNPPSLNLVKSKTLKG